MWVDVALICVCMWCVWQTVGSVELVLSFHHVGSQDWTQISIGSRCLYLLSHLISTFVTFKNWPPLVVGSTSALGSEGSCDVCLRSVSLMLVSQRLSSQCSHVLRWTFREWLDNEGADYQWIDLMVPLGLGKEAVGLAGEQTMEVCPTKVFLIPNLFMPLLPGSWPAQGEQFPFTVPQHHESIFL